MQSDASPDCDACGARSIEALSDMWSPAVPGYRLPIGICKNCGFVTVFPKPPAGQILSFNENWFGDDQPDEAAECARWALFWDRVSPYCSPSSVLDIGARHGFALRHLIDARPGIELFAIELVTEFQERLRDELGAKVFDVDLAAAWPEDMRGRFDLVILRHTLEHLEDPVAALENIARGLTENGLAYIAVPNAMSIKEGHRMRTDWFRPVHAHYFNRDTLVHMAQRAGLYPVACEAAGEIWGLFSADKTYAETPENTYVVQRDLLTKRLAQSWFSDMRAVGKMILRRIVKGR